MVASVVGNTDQLSNLHHKAGINKLFANISHKSFHSVAKVPLTQEAYTGEITQEWRSFKATFEAVTSPRRK